ncbi:MAG: hypothetical protein HZA83_01900 [Thaumarchaeota archaeon]|nr:hypothetical protein [Nitrososphaerota archaeon]
MKNKYLLVALLVVAASAFAISVASAHSTDSSNTGFGMGGMMSMMQGISGNFVHDQNDIDWMKDEMKEHMNLTDEDVNEMTGHCPMMRGR